MQEYRNMACKKEIMKYDLETRDNEVRHGTEKALTETESDNN
jgi:hypothetical protein